ncbi:hypothetical protein BKA83DRAFT_4131858 [Pisolithus microcarpus]|nr:hypothetical protein BKA83DRAFT_4131858 [Pisolithus microcarpus]
MHRNCTALPIWVILRLLLVILVRAVSTIQKTMLCVDSHRRLSHKDEAEWYIHGSLVIFHLAPQDYHWFHVPVNRMIGKMMDILGSMILLMPQAIWSVLGMYGENARKIISIHTVVHKGQRVSRGDELGYVAFVGSMIIMLLEKGMVEWDEDLLIDGHASLERLARVGMGTAGQCRNRFVKGNYIRP